jgi:hypothetical protein
MGEIFLAQQAIAGVDRLVVLKRLLPALAEEPTQLAMFIDEARIAANLTHPNIVQVFEFGQDAQGYFIVMEYVPGHNLGRVLGRAVRDQLSIAPEVGAFIVAELARALDHVHHALDSDGKPLEIVHRDISPTNVLVSYRGDVKLMDFGIARAANRAHRTNDGSVRGKFAYMPPEQIHGQVVDARADVFAAGVVLWELTLHRRLFEGAGDLDVLRAALEQPIPLPSSIDPAYPRELESIVMAALERDPARRIASAAALAAGLKAFGKTRPVDRDDVAALMKGLFPSDAAESEAELTKPSDRDAIPTVILGPPPEPPIPPRRSRAPFVIAVAVMVALGGGAAWLVNSHPADVTRDAGAVAVVTPPHEAAVIDAEVDEIDAEMIDAALRPDAGHKPPPKHPVHADAGVAVVEAVPQRDAAIELVDVTLGLEPGAPRDDVHIAIAGCIGSLPHTCNLASGSHSVHVAVTNGAAFDGTIAVGSAKLRCFVSVANHRVDCK